MNKKEFLAQLDRELATVSEEERTAALQYFTMYFDDAGPEHEADVIAELGSPQDIAKDIKASSGEEGEKWSPPPYPTIVPAVADSTLPPPYYNTPPTGSAAAQAAAAAPTSGWKIVAIILLLVFFSPVLAGLLSAFIGLFIAFVVLLFVPLIISIAFIGSGVAIFAASFPLMGVTFPNGFVMMGCGLLILGLGLLCGYFAIWLIAKAIPACFRGIASLFRAIFKKGGK